MNVAIRSETPLVRAASTKGVCAPLSRAMLVVLCLALAACGQRCGGDAASETAQPVTAEVDRDAFRALPPGPLFVATVDVDAVVRLTQQLSGDTTPNEVFRAAFQQQFASVVGPDEPFWGELNLVGLHSVLVAGYPTADGDGDGLIITQASAMRTAPADGAPPVAVTGESELRMFRRGDTLVVGSGAVFENALAMEPSAPHFDPDAAWGAGWGAASEGALFSVLSMDVPATSTLFGEDALPPQLQAIGAQRMALGVRPQGGMTLAVEAANHDALLAPLARAQVAFSQAMLGTAVFAPPAAQGWIQYLNLIHRTAWSQLEIAREGTLSTFRLPDTTCGSPIGYALLGLVYGGLAMDAEPSAAAPVFTEFEGSVRTDCGPMAGPPAALPRELTRLAPSTTSSDSTLVLVDLGALLRSNLPTLFGLLPFGMTDDDLNAAFGEAPMGMQGLSDPNAKIGAFIATGPFGPSEITAVLPSGMHGTLPIPPSPGMVNQLVPDVGFVLGTEGAAERAVRERDATSPWALVVDALPSDATLALAFPPSVVTEAAAEIGPIAGIESVTAAAVALTANLQPSVHLHTTGDAAALAAAIEAVIFDALADTTTAGSDMDAMQNAWREGLEIAHEGALVSVSLTQQMDLAPWAAIGGFIALMVPNLTDFEVGGPAPGGKP